ncbi:glutaredoxin family protein [Pseudocolwellia agarivorans]|uniref:glutaredoxin family protein n=1 Tax=Pseudocolwellia agarivorans TaxID=1911682 RepID=UPI003F885D4C
MKDTTFALYKLDTCPYCVKTIKVIKSLNIEVSLKDINESKKHNNALIQEGGKRQVPCLKIVKNNSAPVWLYESDEIIEFLKNSTI